MKRLTFTDFLLPITALVLALVYVIPMLFTQPDERRMLFDAEEPVSGIHYISKDVDITFALLHGQWTITEPEKWLARESELNKVLDRLAEAEVLSVIRIPSNLAKYGLDTPERLTLTFGDEQRTYLLGGRDKSMKMMYIQIEGEESIQVVKADFANFLPVSVNQMKDRTIFRVDPAEIKAVEVEIGEKFHKLERTGSGDWLADGKERPNTEIETVLMESVAPFEANTFYDNVTLPANAQQHGRVAITLTDGSRHEIPLYLNGTDFLVPVQNAVLVVYSFKFEEFFKQFGDTLSGE